MACQTNSRKVRFSQCPQLTRDYGLRKTSKNPYQKKTDEEEIMGPGGGATGGSGGFHPGQYGPRVTSAQPGTIEHYQRYGTWGSTRGEPSSRGMPGSIEYYGRHGTFGDPTRPSDPVANPHLRGNTYNLQFSAPKAAVDTRRFGTPVNVADLYPSGLANVLASQQAGQRYTPQVQNIRNQFLSSII